MSDSVMAALIGLCGGVIAAVVAALYTVGGLPALQRRTMKQELDLMLALPRGPLRELLNEQIDKRLTLYLARSVARDVEWRRHRLPVAVHLVFWLLVGVGPWFLWTDATTGWVGLVLAVVQLGAFAQVGVLLGEYVSQSVRRARMNRRRRQVEQAELVLRVAAEAKAVTQDW